MQVRENPAQVNLYAIIQTTGDQNLHYLQTNISIFENLNFSESEKLKMLVHEYIASIQNPDSKACLYLCICLGYTSQSLYNTIVGVHSINRVS